MTTLLSIKKLASLGLLSISVCGISACNDDLLTETPRDIIVADNLYTDVGGFENALNGVYAQVRQVRHGYNNSANSIMNMAWTIGVDNAWANYVSTPERIFNDWGVLNNPLEGDFRTIWTHFYETVNAANTIVGRAENPNVEWTEAQKNEIIAEARFFRAWAYRSLTYLWGDVPLTLTESSGENVRTDWTRASRQEVWKQIEEDLLFAEQYLPEASSSSGRLTKAVAQHYLAELYLAMDQPGKAEEKASAVINSGLYSLITERYGVHANEPGVPFMDLFRDGNVNRDQGNTEVLWALELQKDVAGGGENIMRRSWVARYYTIKGLQVSEEYGGRGIGRLAPTAWALNLYEPEDDRGSFYAIRKFYQYNDPGALPKGKELGDTLFTKADVEKVNSANWPTTRKWDWADPLDIEGNSGYGDQPYVRLAETYLLLAEAQFKQGNLAEAAATLNTVRRRSHASEITPDQVTLDFILDERSRELLTEEERRFTLLRTHTWLERTQKYNPIAGPNVTPRDTVFPIPQSVIDANTGAPLPQNPGY